MKLKDFLEKAVEEVVIYAGTNLVDYNPNNYVYTSNETYTPVKNDYLEIEGVELTEVILNSNVEHIGTDTIDFMGETKATIEVYVN